MSRDPPERSLCYGIYYYHGHGASIKGALYRGKNMDATLNFELKHIREELHSISTSLKRIANELEEMKPKKEEVCEGEEFKKDETTI